MYQDELNAKFQAQAAYEAQKSYGDGQALDSVCTNAATGFSPRLYTLAEDAARNEQYHSDQAKKHAGVAHFLSKNPAFDEFIRLVRSGAIQF